MILDTFHIISINRILREKHIPLYFYLFFVPLERLDNVREVCKTKSIDKTGENQVRSGTIFLTMYDIHKHNVID